MELRALIVWLILVILAVANGIFRNSVVTPVTGELGGHYISSLILSGLILFVSWLFVDWIGPTSSEQAWAIGIGWLLLTISFEFLAGHFLFGNSWERLFADYNIFKGRVWILVLLVTLIAPQLAARWRELIP